MWRARLDTSLVRCTGAVAATKLMLEQEVRLRPPPARMVRVQAMNDRFLWRTGFTSR